MKNMSYDDAITVTKLRLQNEKYCYLMIGWAEKSFDMYLYSFNKLWRGKFSPGRLAGFSKNLHMTEIAYFDTLKKCLSKQNDNYRYELKSGFFYWKRRLRDSIVIEGFLPVDDSSPADARPDLVEVLLTLNNNLKDKVNKLNYKYVTIKEDYEKCLRDTEEFLNLKIDMEKALCDKFLNLLTLKKDKIDALQSQTSEHDLIVTNSNYIANETQSEYEKNPVAIITVQSLHNQCC